MAGGARTRARLSGSLVEARELKRRQEVAANAKRAMTRASGGQAVLADGELTIDDYFTRWLRHDEGRIAPGTLAGREGAYRNHLRATFASVRVADVNAQLIEDWLHSQCRAGIGYWATKGAYHALQAMFSTAVRKRHVEWNPTSAVDLPREPVRAHRDHMTGGEYRAVVDACQTSEEQLWVRLSGEAGLRRGEICALRAERVDIARRELVVSASTVHVRGAGLVERPPKSGKPRIVAITGGLALLITQHIDEAALEPGDLLFTAPTDDGPMKPDTLTDKVSRIIYRAGLRTVEHKPAFSLHDLRRTAATLARERGVAVDVIRDQLGHGHVQMTTRHYIRARSNPHLSQFADAMELVANGEPSTPPLASLGTPDQDWISGP